jgi:hypothetical protein
MPFVDDICPCYGGQVYFNAGRNSGTTAYITRSATPWGLSAPWPPISLHPSTEHSLGIERAHLQTWIRSCQSAMSSDVTLRIAYFSLNLVGGFAMTIMIFTLCLEIRRLRQGMFLATLALCSSRIISTVVSSLLCVPYNLKTSIRLTQSAKVCFPAQ